MYQARSSPPCGHWKPAGQGTPTHSVLSPSSQQPPSSPSNSDRVRPLTTFELIRCLLEELVRGGETENVLVPRVQSPHEEPSHGPEGQLLVHIVPHVATDEQEILGQE